VVLPDPEEVHADLVGKDTLFDDVADRLGVAKLRPSSSQEVHRRLLSHRILPLAW
jgi:hypothetical protein